MIIVWVGQGFCCTTSFFNVVFLRVTARVPFGHVPLSGKCYLAQWDVVIVVRLLIHC